MFIPSLSLSTLSRIGTAFMSSHSRAARLAVGAPRRDTHTHLPLAFPDVFRPEGDVAPLPGNINLSITSPPSPFNSCLCPGTTCIPTIQHRPRR
ncbi:hypothetical protein B0H19DRAFT_1203403 [Mycena capillaripes]|nr:hypothetical protein B0H19DRAFT_1203403 [Mycena capillaripes]